MKIHAPSPLHRLEAAQRLESRAARSAAPMGEAEGAVLKETASFVQSLRETASGTNLVRMGEVARAREDILSGAINSEAEIAAAVDGFIASV